MTLHHALHTCSQRSPQPKPKAPRAANPGGSLSCLALTVGPARCAHSSSGPRRGPAAYQDVN